MIEKNQILAGSDKNKLYNGIVYDFRLIDILSNFN